jgi:hypothetical protein
MLTASILQNVPLHEHDSLVDIRAIPVSGCSEWADAISAQSCLCQFLSNYTEEESAPAVFAWLTSTGAAHAIFGLATANVSQHMQVLPQALKGALDGARSSALQVNLSQEDAVLQDTRALFLYFHDSQRASVFRTGSIGASTKRTLHSAPCFLSQFWMLWLLYYLRPFPFYQKSSSR